MSHVMLTSIFSTAVLAAFSALAAPVEPALEIGQPPAGMRWATPQEKANAIDFVDAALTDRSEREISLDPSICIGQLDLPSGWSWSSGPDAPLHGGDEWSESYDNPDKNARLVISGNMDSNGSFCGTHLQLIPWDARMRPNNSFKPKPLRGSA
jgi:hypothetical protein